MSNKMQGLGRALLIVVSAPSGGGKTTLCDMLRKEIPSIEYSISCTTRKPRGNEVDGEDYHFLSEKEFDARVALGDFLEHAVVHGYKYGTLRAAVAGALENGRSVLMDIDVQGARQIRDRVRAAPAGDILKKGFVDIFIAPPSLEALRQRLVKRAEDKPEVIERRLHNAEVEMRSAGEYRYQVVNDVLEKAYAGFRELIRKEAAS
jgi:guanylate kinase